MIFAADHSLLRAGRPLARTPTHRAKLFPIGEALASTQSRAAVSRRRFPVTNLTVPVSSPARTRFRANGQATPVLSGAGFFFPRSRRAALSMLPRL